MSDLCSRTLNCHILFMISCKTYEFRVPPVVLTDLKFTLLSERASLHGGA